MPKPIGLFLISIEKGADTVVWHATAPALSQVSGEYFFKREKSSPARRDAELCAKLWTLFEQIANTR